MLLTQKPGGVTTHEQNILWSMAELRKGLYAQASTTAHPHKVLESQGYYPSDVLSVTELKTIDGGDRHAVRLLIPVDSDYYGSGNPVWEFAGTIAP